MINCQWQYLMKWQADELANDQKDQFIVLPIFEMTNISHAQFVKWPVN